MDQHSSHQSFALCTGTLSQSFRCNFLVEGIQYCSSLQYMFHQKALIFKDDCAAKEVLEVKDVRQYQKIFDSLSVTKSMRNDWDSLCEEVVMKGNSEKFKQVDNFKKDLLNTAGKTIIFAHTQETLLGVGLHEKHTGLGDSKQWRGKNKLGFVLMDIRDSFLSSFQWTAGDKCMAQWPQDKLLYKATIVRVQSDKCTVNYTEYNEEATLPMKLVVPKLAERSDSRNVESKRSVRSNSVKRRMSETQEDDWDTEHSTPRKVQTKSKQPNIKFFFTANDILSQWYACKFQVKGIWYNCAEQYMMHQKAEYFDDEKMANDILAAKRPVHQKELGRKVSGYDDDKWNSVCQEIVKQGNIAKFSQNKNLREYLLSTKDAILAEASPSDRKWGIGLSANNPLAWCPDNWRGQNLLGQVLMEVREKLSQIDSSCFSLESTEVPIDEAEEGYTLFWRSKSPFSQWHPAWFNIDGIEYNCAEQFMMYQKALFFHDMTKAREILAERDPRRQKQIAKGVKNFDETSWNKVSKDFVRKGTVGKYSQNADLRRELFATANTVLVEASADDFRWGIGSTKDDRQSWNRRTWRGENWLGNIITDVRQELMSQEWTDMETNVRMQRNDEGISYRAFSLPQSPFHLFYPAEIQMFGRLFKSAGHYVLYSLAAKVGNQKIADDAMQLTDTQPLLNLLDTLLAGIEEWNQSLETVVFDCNVAKFRQHESLMRKLVDSVPDVLVYAGTERHLGIDYQQRVPSVLLNENRLGKILMEIRDKMAYQSDMPIRFVERRVNNHRRSSEDYWSGATTPRSTARDTTVSRRNRVQHGLGAPPTSRQDVDERTQRTARQNYRDPSFEAEKREPKTCGDYQQAQQQKSRPQQQQQPEVVIFSDSNSPLHLWYPAPIKIAGQRYLHAGQYLLHKAATEVFKDSEKASSILKMNSNDNVDAFEDYCGSFSQRVWMDFIQDDSMLQNLVEEKFSQNTELRRALLDTCEAKIIFASTDRLLGSGCTPDDDEKLKSSKMRGKNYLGKALVRTRENLKQQSMQCDSSA